jgi:ribose transport system permease protein
MADEPAGPIAAAEHLDDDPRGSRRTILGFAAHLADSPEIGIVIAVIAAFAIFTAINPLFASIAELQNLGVDLAGFGILAVGESFAILTGGIDLSVGSLTALCVVLSARLNVTEHIPVLPAFLLTIVFGAAVGFHHAFWITRLGVPPFIITLVTFIFAAGADEAIAQSPIPISSPTFLAVATSTVAGVPIAVVVLVVIALLAWFFLERTYVGRQIYAVGGNREAARLAGIPTNRRIVVAYVVSGGCAGVVGIIVASHLTSGTADSVTGYELIAIASAVIGGVSLIGGQGRIVGVVAGAALLVVLEQGLVAVNVNAYYQSMVVGFVLFVAVVADRLRVRYREHTGSGAGRAAATATLGEVRARSDDPEHERLGAGTHP